MPQSEEFIATGRRKTSVARVRMMAGSGKIDINGRTFEDYFPTVPLQNVVLQPLQNAKAVNTYDVFIHASGGGIMGQAGAAQLAIARALLQVDTNLRGPLKSEGLLRRDPRMKERKKIRATRGAEAVPVLQTLGELPIRLTAVVSAALSAVAGTAMPWRFRRGQRTLQRSTVSLATERSAADLARVELAARAQEESPALAGYLPPLPVAASML